MDGKTFFFERYNGFQEYPENLLRGMTELQIRQSPHPTVNPIAWLLWHMARCEDVAVNRLLVDRRQVLDDGVWSHRLGQLGRQCGTEMTKAEVQELSETVDLSDLVAYRSAVAERTMEVVQELPLEELTAKLRAQELNQVFVSEGAGGKAADFIIEAYTGQTKGWLLGHLVLTHNFYHMGQAFQVRGMWGLPSVW